MRCDGLEPHGDGDSAAILNTFHTVAQIAGSTQRW